MSWSHKTTTKKHEWIDFYQTRKERKETKDDIGGKWREEWIASIDRKHVMRYLAGMSMEILCTRYNYLECVEKEDFACFSNIYVCTITV